MSLSPVSGSERTPFEPTPPKSILKKPKKELIDGPKAELRKANITWAQEKKVRILEIQNIESKNPEDEGWGSAEDLQEVTSTKETIKEIISDSVVPLKEEGIVRDLLRQKELDSLGNGNPAPKQKTGIVSFNPYETKEVDFLWNNAMKMRNNKMYMPTEDIFRQFQILEHKMYHLFDEDSDIFPEQSDEFKEIVTDSLFQKTLTKTYKAYEELLHERGISLDPNS